MNDEEGAEDGEHAGTANRGADLAEWLEQCQRQPDLSFYPRRRNDAEFQLEEWWRFGGVGSAGNTSDELPAVELDLKLEELAAGISTLPLHEYLRLPDIMRDADTVDDDGSECEQQAQGTKEGKIEEQVRGADQHEAGPLMALEKGEQMDMLDQELDSLLTLSERPHALEKDNAEKDSVVQQSFPPGAGDQSLEDWLDSL